MPDWEGCGQAPFERVDIQLASPLDVAVILRVEACLIGSRAFSLGLLSGAIDRYMGLGPRSGRLLTLPQIGRYSFKFTRIFFLKPHLYAFN
jgi:hypothetical protein